MGKQLGSVELSGLSSPLVLTFGNLIDIEKRMGKSIARLGADAVTTGISISELSIIASALSGHTKEEAGEAILEEGVNPASKKITDLLSQAFDPELRQKKSKKG